MGEHLLRIVVLLVLLISVNCFSNIINIPEDYSTIQSGIDASNELDTVLVQPGIYLENINYEGKNITVTSLFSTTQDTAYISATIIDGDSSGSVASFESGENSTAVLSGFTLTNGFNYYGGGIYCSDSSSPCLNDLKIISNSADYGAGVYCRRNSIPSLNNIEIIENFADDYGGGIYCRIWSNISVKNVIISNNYANRNGGGIYSWASIMDLENVVISSNYANYPGGGIFCYYYSDMNIKNVIIANNTTSQNGGGMLIGHESYPTLYNVLIKGNSAEYDGGGIYCTEASPNLINVTLVNNTAGSCGGIYYNGETYSKLVNCILWDNGIPSIYTEMGVTVNVDYSNIEGGYNGEGNIETDPLFADTLYHLSADSPCIDAGTQDTTDLNLPLVDLDGNYRIWDGDGDDIAIIDMGSYEFGSPIVNSDLVSILFKEEYLLYNYPNPFNPTTTIDFSIPNDSEINLSIYNLKGQIVKTLANEQLERGNHSVVWHGIDKYGKAVSSGVYFYKLKVNGKNEAAKKCLLLK